jgi:short-subunit dehydrogenase
LGTGEALSIEQTERLYQVNTIGPERIIKAVLPFMHRQHEGLIINITSVQSRQFIHILLVKQIVDFNVDILPKMYAS